MCINKTILKAKKIQLEAQPQMETIDPQELSCRAREMTRANTYAVNYVDIARISSFKLFKPYQ